MPDADITPPSFTRVNAEMFRESLKHFEADLRSYISGVKEGSEDLFDKGECIAQAMLALRHVEDARMRLGKVIQYAGNGESCYQK